MEKPQSCTAANDKTVCSGSSTSPVHSPYESVDAMETMMDRGSKDSDPNIPARIDRTLAKNSTDEASGVSSSDEPISVESENNGYVLVGRQRRKMSNAVAALDLDLQPKRRPSYSRRQTSAASAVSSATSTPSGGGAPRFSVGGGKGPLSFTSENGQASSLADGKTLRGEAYGASPMSTVKPSPPTGYFDPIFWPMTSTEQLMSKHSFKTQMSQNLQRMDHAFPFLNSSPAGVRYRDTAVHGLDELNRAVEDVWKKPQLGNDLASGMADHLRSSSNLDTLCRYFIDDRLNLRREAGRTIENYFSDRNRDYVLQQPWFAGEYECDASSERKQRRKSFFVEFLSVLINDETRDERPRTTSSASVLSSTMSMRRDRERYRLSASILESIIRHGPETCLKIVDAGGLDFLLRTCRYEWENGDGEDRWETLHDVSSALCNLAVLGGRDVRKAMVEKNIPAWMFVLLSHKDPRIRYHACLIVTIIASEHDFEAVVEQSQTLPLVISFMQTHRPADMAPLDEKYRTGRSKRWLTEIATMIQASRRPEVQALGCFQMAKEAHVRRTRDIGTQVFEEVGVLSTLKEIAASPLNPLAADFAEQVLRIAGEVLPRKLSQSVPLWSVGEVEFWVEQIGFGEYSSQFAKYRVDGDLLLRTNDRLLINEIGMNSEYERLRFMRELGSLKRSADYGCVDPTRLDMWMMGLDKDMSTYTYDMLLNGIDRRTLIHADESILKNEAGITNSVHRMKILHAIKEVKHVEELDIALLRKHVDIFICYRRSTGSQLASLLKVHLQLRGYKVFIDVDRLYAGQFDTSLLKNVRAAKHFILVLTPHALDRCVDDHGCKDWVHLEMKTALEFGRNIVPVQDKGFVWPELNTLPTDIRPIAFFNAVQWVHEYQEACVEKLDKFLKGEQATQDDGGTPSIGCTGGSRILTTAPQRASVTVEAVPAISKQISECMSSRPSLTRSTTLARLDSA